VAARLKTPKTLRSDPPEGDPITFHGEVAYYTTEELREMQTLADHGDEGVRCAELIHALKARLDATLLPSA
jgi:hypothetical protein